MLVQKNGWLVPVILVVLFGGSWLVTARPIGTEEQVASEYDASSPVLEILPGTANQQRFGALDKPLRGFIIYAPANNDLGKIHLRVTNEKSGETVTSYRYTTSVRGDSQRVVFLLPQLTAAPKDVLMATIINPTARSLFLLTHTAGRITFSTLQPVPPTPAITQGVIAATMVALAALLLELLPLTTRQRWWGVCVILLALPLFAVTSFWFSSAPLGVADWDYRFSLHEIYRQAVVAWHQFPLWNPYTCGGAGGLADPEFSVISPTFLLELLLGVPVGTKLGIYVGLIVLSLGMVSLGKSLRLSWRATLIAALITTYSSAFILKIVEGHVTIIYAFMWVPWIFWAWRMGYLSPRINWRWVLLTGLFLALAFYQGGIYILSYTALALLMLGILVPRRRQALLSTIIAFLWGAGFSAFKLLPVLYWLKQYPDAHYVPSTATLFHLADIFVRRHLHGSYILPGQLSGWHEYGAYLGFVVIGISALAVIHVRRRRLVRLLGFAVLITAAAASLGPLLQPYFDYLPFIPRSNISRLALFTVVAFSLLAGLGLDTLYRRSGLRQGLVLAVLFFAALDILTLSSTLADQAFVVPAVFPSPSPAPWPLAYSNEHFVIRKNGQEYNRSYAATLAGYGSFSFCSVLGPLPHVATITPEGVPPFAVVSTAGEVMPTHWSPNNFTVRYRAPANTQVTINMNYAPGWLVNGRAAKDDGGRLAADVMAGEGELDFSYRPPLILLGAALNIFAMLAAGYVVATTRHE